MIYSINILETLAFFVFLSIKNNILIKKELRGSKKYTGSIQEGTKREPDGDKKQLTILPTPYPKQKTY